MHVPWNRGRQSLHSFVFLKPCVLFYLSWLEMTSKSLRGIPDVHGIPRESIRAPCKIHLGGSFLGKNITLVKPGRILPPNSQGKKMLYSYCLASALSGDNMCQSESRLIFTACISSNCLFGFVQRCSGWSWLRPAPGHCLHVTPTPTHPFTSTAVQTCHTPTPSTGPFKVQKFYFYELWKFQ